MQTPSTPSRLFSKKLHLGLSLLASWICVLRKVRFLKKELIIRRLSEVYESKLDDIPSAIDAQLRLVEETELTEVSVGVLRRLYTTSQQFAEFYTVLTEYAATLSEPEVVIPCQLELSEIALNHLSDEMGSIGHLKTIIELDPSHSGARMGLESLLSHDTVQTDVSIDP